MNLRNAGAPTAAIIFILLFFQCSSVVKEPEFPYPANEVLEGLIPNTKCKYPTAGTYKTYLQSLMVKFTNPGTFMMGIAGPLTALSTGEKNATAGLYIYEMPGSSVTLTTFSLMQVEVTNAMYVEYLNCRAASGGFTRYDSRMSTDNNIAAISKAVSAQPDTCPDQYKNPYNPADVCYNPFYEYALINGLESNPVSYIDYFDAKGFCEWAGLRLPTEMEWEYGARSGQGGNKNVYPQGGTYGAGDWLNGGNYVMDCIYGNYAACKTGADPLPAAVGSTYPNAAGLYDMAGNVMEWTASLWTPTLPPSSETNIDTNETDKSSLRVVRGGSYMTSPPWVRTTYRGDLNNEGVGPFYPGHRAIDLGFRCAG